MEDLVNIISLCFRYSSFKYVVICTFWGVLAPLDLFAKCFKTCGTFIGTLIWAVVTAFPFLAAFKLFPDFTESVKLQDGQ